MNGVIRPSVSPGSSQRLTSVTCTPTTSAPSCGAAHAGATAARRARTTSPSSRVRRPGGSGAGERIDVLHALGQAMLAPRAAAVLGAEDLAGAAHAVDALGVGRVQRDGHHGRLRLDAVVEALPRLAHVVAAVERAVLAARGGTEARVHHARILRTHADVAAVGERREAPHLHVLDRKSTRLNSSHPSISYAVFCLKKKKNKDHDI